MKASKTSNTGAWDFPGGENVKEGSEERRIEAQRKKRVETNVGFFQKSVYWFGPRTHGVFSQQVVFSVGLAAVDGPQSAKQRPPSRQDLRRTHLHQLAYRCHHLQPD